MLQGHIDKTNEGRTANIERNSHKPRRDGDCGDNDLSLPDGNAADPVPSSDSQDPEAARVGLTCEGQ
jgi:hypothetical protein